MIFFTDDGLFVLVDGNVDLPDIGLVVDLPDVGLVVDLPDVGLILNYLNDLYYIGF